MVSVTALTKIIQRSRPTIRAKFDKSPKQMLPQHCRRKKKNNKKQKLCCGLKITPHTNDNKKKEQKKKKSAMK